MRKSPYSTDVTAFEAARAPVRAIHPTRILRACFNAVVLTTAFAAHAQTDITPTPGFPFGGGLFGDPIPVVGASRLSSVGALRLLDQATFGPTPADVKGVQASGVAAWVDAQLSTPTTGYAPMDYISSNSTIGCPTGAVATCYRDNYTPFLLQLQFFRNAVSGADQLRQRVAFAYSQIFVISGIDIKPAYGVRAFQQMLLDNAFGNYRTLLQRVTLSPAMGDYLDMVNNDKPNLTAGTNPNENYAREVLQLFSIGLVKLNPDGSAMLDAAGKPVPSYDPDTVKGFARAFSGWTYAPLANTTSRWINPVNYQGDMVPFDAHHDTSAKVVLSGRTLAAGQGAVADLNAALDNIYQHPNVGTFIGRQLIQALVTSNPTPAYVSRITAVFNDNGQGVRGDMKAVVRAILLDTEARTDRGVDFNFGKLRDPAVYAAGVARAFGAKTDGVYLNAQASAMGQGVYLPPSVFSFYPPDYALPNSATLLGPQFGLQNTTTTVARLNFLYSLFYSTSGIAPDASVAGAIGTKIDLTAYSALASTPPAMVDSLDANLTHATLTSTERNSIVSAVNAVSASDPLGRARMAAYLLAASPRYQITR